MAQNALDDRLAEQFEGDLHGPLIRPGDSDYDDARAVWNGMIDKYPGLIAQCSGVADVIRSVNFARENDIPVSVRGGGHNVAGTAVCDDGLVIDCSEMTGVKVDPDAQTAWVQSGATWADLDHETQEFGLATPGGVVSDTGIAGLTLGGGIGHLRCKYGLSCDNLRSVELVTADGEFLRASADENPELFWGLRGGGGNFGVVTAFEYELHPVGPEVATCLVFYSADKLTELLQAYRGFVATAPEEISSLVFAGELPDEELFSGADVHRQKFAIMGCYAGPPDVGEVELAPLREFAEPIADFSGTMPYTEFQQLLDEEYPDGMRYYWKSLYLDGLSRTAIDRIEYWAEAAPSPLSTVDVWQLGGAIEDIGIEESAFAGRHAPFLLGVEANWEDAEHDEANVQWVRDCLDDMRQFSDGSVYLNFPGFLEEGDEMMQTTFGPAYERLVALKDEYDPTNLFNLNQNIAPSEEV
ncbi:FAD-binding oxidoreductase [Haloferax mediterranei ATCC 33500]|uniref:FAD-binding oxidoreductase n=1 Tax=Haloferax mediterranei (strain ATCC 33500 / DSM 1411 / JCM 8866 / NBRC 14739 / NCIMB 2177 / R-4) TaxID=523841 RepID=I3R6X4_HALMT|nr:FAD-binding oxidoreductase [Haloferax mediterranei]AFK19984.1 FAD/FMN-dependent dehydrogenase [Haloferax mediterranei ATCC 33500]AHZ23363.1 FAD-linked oxidase [Haloferax mediterranei ATCC 33500]ELZ99531.1 FAD/FMN-dependent dehydrogenase [Haloferax mediterranei ATCC 33500]MDX5987263.1 FAD-binding oxidoreductase [Haloferax mediterranei ATCC 33500]QCQ73785.1 FAD-binding oxidoreductase [Haloferax mediterranei ATCC 33500]